MDVHVEMAVAVELRVEAEESVGVLEEQADLR